ncbi:helix-turn-helix domain-containing protein [Clostridium beijerinckii]|uniref:AraC family transcriptional regulator n=2 Tax=Clostridium beijerinckii TaxID=1520 RepID=A0A140DMJ7_CLOBE|nr:AraC family transcriptional regulator [Clostridium beijerinckii]AMK50490.1 AraC family transcriptional regulator [Clostridium beijerinckii]AQS07357.1 HTH-type transcriptional activator Btr [Clostridium beijerinckii]MBA2884582.1 AraC-like DNA-binding protein [Clostridium beijerinckii]MBA2898048.1 AraC-like DNA-binding protein [Clostridium beijerinckii]MBA2909899.1 AraC-like DNA-binding protein [Clostridium beijerinckii]
MKSVIKGELIKEFRENTFEIVRVDKFAKNSASAKNTYKTNLSAFIFPIKGRAEIEFDNEIFTGERGKVIHGCKNKNISFKVLGKEEFEHINIYYVADKYNNSNSYMKSTFEFAVNNYDEIIKSLNQLIEISSKAEIKSKVTLQIQTFLFLRELFTERNYKKILTEKDIVTDISKFISENYMKEITLNKLAERYGEKVSRVSYLFNKHLKMRPIDYLIQYRLTVAYTLLNKGLTVKEVSRKVGYSDEFYFSRLFKKKFGVSPNKLKKG